MTLTQLHYLITIAETKSLNKSGRTLYVPQPSLTNAMKELEKELGLVLLYRGGKGVALTNDGAEFCFTQKKSAINMKRWYRNIAKRKLPKKFGVSTQHYSFAVKAFVDMAKEFDMSKYEFAIRETETRKVLSDVSTLRSEIGVLYLSDFNRKAMEKMMKTASLEFHPLISCGAYVYLWKQHPLAKETSIRFEQLSGYPCLSFEQGENSSFYFAEEILSTNEYAQIIKANDRATMLNLMVGLNGYTSAPGLSARN